MSDFKRLTILIPYWKRPVQYLECCLSSIRENGLSVLDYEIVISTCGPRDYVDAVVAIGRRFDAVVVEYLKGLNVSNGSLMKNIAFRHAEYTHMVMDLDGDCLVTPSMAFLIESVPSDQATNFNGFGLKEEDGLPEVGKTVEFCEKMIEKYEIGPPRLQTNTPTLANVMLPFGLYEKMGGWCEAFMGWGREDNDFNDCLDTWGIKHVSYTDAGGTAHMWHPHLHRVSSLSKNLYEKRKEERTGKKNVRCNEGDWGQGQCTVYKYD